ncbi:MAG: protein-glutamate O-methyltransferase CheR [Magnetococcales bacterium]|nr:protein-glutamate O-methyltransferase CheR [Magnetococcales bacterium]
MSVEHELSDKKFSQLSEFIYAQCGILMPPAKKTMLTARIQKRLRTLGMHSFSEYVDWVLDPVASGDELYHFIDIVTTNKTDFFREAAHFDYMRQTALPELVQTGAGVRRRFMIWSAACSTGEEPYTLAMVMKEFGETVSPSFQVQILGTDISTRVLKKAATAIYEMEKVEPVLISLKKKYLLKSKDPTQRLVKMGPELRAIVKFQRVNFMDRDYGIRDQFDIIFCRNVIIYFDRPTTEQIVNKLCRNLVPGGYLFIGHSESLNGLKVPVVSVAPTVYRKLS